MDLLFSRSLETSQKQQQEVQALTKVIDGLQSKIEVLCEENYRLCTRQPPPPGLRVEPGDDNAQEALGLLVPTLCTNVNSVTKFWNLYYIGTNQEMSYEMAEKLYKQGKIENWRSKQNERVFWSRAVRLVKFIQAQDQREWPKVVAFLETTMTRLYGNVFSRLLKGIVQLEITNVPDPQVKLTCPCCVCKDALLSSPQAAIDFCHSKCPISFRKFTQTLPIPFLTPFPTMCCAHQLNQSP